jgi:PAS domain S-box-containing protein
MSHEHLPVQTAPGVQTVALADAMPFVVWTHDADGVPGYFNRAWTEYTGLSAEETLRVGAASLVHPEDMAALEHLFTESRRTGTAMSATYRLRRHDGCYRWHDARVVPLEVVGGRAVSFVGTASDVDAQRQLSQRQAFLAEAGKVLGTSLELQRTLSDVARLVVPHLADWCAVDLVAEGGGFERLAVAHVDPSKVALAHELWKRVPPKPDDPSGLAAVVRTGKAELLEDIPDSLLVAALPDPELLALYRGLGLRSSMSVPLSARGRVLGALSLVSAESGRRYGKGDLAFAEDLAGRISVAVDNARLYTEAQQARTAAEALAADVLEQSRDMEKALRALQAERDAAREQLARVQRGGQGGA